MDTLIQLFQNEPTITQEKEVEKNVETEAEEDNETWILYMIALFRMFC
jgi:hypothetical protein